MVGSFPVSERGTGTKPTVESEMELRRVSIPYRLPNGAGPSGATNLNASLFIEDAAENLFPLDGRVGVRCVFRLAPEDGRISRVVASGFGGFDYHGASGRLEACLVGFGVRSIHDLLSKGLQTYEVAPKVDAKGRTVGFGVVQVDGARRVAGVTWQIVPKGALTFAMGEGPKTVDRHRVRIPKDRVVHMSLPREYRRLSRGLRVLADVERPVPEFVLESIGDAPSSLARYDANELQQMRQRAIASITRRAGWNGRWVFDDAATGYYLMRRFLRFEAFKARLRSTVVDAVNRILAIAGAAVGFEAVASLHHLPTLDEIRVSCDDLAAGRLDFLKTREQYSMYSRRQDPPDLET